MAMIRVRKAVDVSAFTKIENNYSYAGRKESPGRIYKRIVLAGWCACEC